jgi:uncharacterized protein (DUF488 family)
MERFIKLLASYHVTAVADVRSHPYSRFNPQFNRANLNARLKTGGISYVFLGCELGARPEDRSCYINGTVQYDRLAQTALFQEGLRRIADGLRKYRIVLLCAEKDPLMCHRTILICRHLVTQGISGQHILEDGRLESHDEAIARLLMELGLPERDLFRNRDHFIIEAYNRRGQQIAYTEKDYSPEEALREVRK